MFTKTIIVVAVAAAFICLTSADSDEKKNNHYGKKYDDDAKYQFKYQVRAGNKGYGSDSGEDSAEFGHSETRDGDDTKGIYFVDLPDGRRQTVEYYVNGDSGYVAKVSYGSGSQSEEKPKYDEPSKGYKKN